MGRRGAIVVDLIWLILGGGVSVLRDMSRQVVVVG